MKLTPKLTFKSQSASSKEKFCPTNNLSTDYNTAVEGQPLHTALPDQRGLFSPLWPDRLEDCSTFLYFSWEVKHLVF